MLFFYCGKEGGFYLVRLFRIITHIFFLYVLLLVGNFLQEAFQLFIPGSVIGMLLLFALLKLGIVKLRWIEEGTSLLLKHLTLFFIPVTVGFIEYFDAVFSVRGVLLLSITIISTALVMGGSGAVSEYLARRKEVQH